MEHVLVLKDLAVIFTISLIVILAFHRLSSPDRVSRFSRHPARSWANRKYSRSFHGRGRCVASPRTARSKSGRAGESAGIPSRKIASARKSANSNG